MRAAYSALGVRLPGYVIAFVLAVLLVSTTPVGTGTGVHQFDLVHPLFEHTHLVNGRVLTHEQIARGEASPPRSTPSRGPALGGGTGASATDAGLGVGPAFPTLLGPLLYDLRGEWRVMDVPSPPDRREAPPSPPPLAG